jgi:nucleoside-diphosphate-sugar epimerase
MTILEFAEAVNEISGNPGNIIFKESLRIAGDPQTRRPDTTRAREILKWEPRVDLADGLTRTIEYFRKVINS